jgi:hypothetical protein
MGGSFDLNLKLDSDFDNLRVWNFEVSAWPLGIMMHERK